MDIVYSMVTIANAPVQYIGKESEEWILGIVITRRAFFLFPFLVSFLFILSM